MRPARFTLCGRAGTQPRGITNPGHHESACGSGSFERPARFTSRIRMRPARFTLCGWAGTQPRGRGSKRMELVCTKCADGAGARGNGARRATPSVLVHHCACGDPRGVRGPALQFASPSAHPPVFAGADEGLRMFLGGTQDSLQPFQPSHPCS